MLLTMFVKMLVCIVQAFLLVIGIGLKLIKGWSYTAQTMPEYAGFL